MNIVSPVQHPHSQIKPNHVLIGKKKNTSIQAQFYLCEDTQRAIKYNTKSGMCTGDFFCDLREYSKTDKANGFSMASIHKLQAVWITALFCPPKTSYFPLPQSTFVNLRTKSDKAFADVRRSVWEVSKPFLGTCLGHIYTTAGPSRTEESRFLKPEFFKSSGFSSLYRKKNTFDPEKLRFRFHWFSNLCINVSIQFFLARLLRLSSTFLGSCWW